MFTDLSDYLFNWKTRKNEVSLSQRNSQGIKNPTIKTVEEFLRSTGSIRNNNSNSETEEQPININSYNNSNSETQEQRINNSNNLTQAQPTTIKRKRSRNNRNNINNKLTFTQRQRQPVKKRPRKKGGKKSKRKIHIGPRGGKYYIKKGKKVYLKK